MSKSANKMSVLQLTILTAVNMMGSGIIMLPSSWHRWAHSLSFPGLSQR